MSKKCGGGVLAYARNHHMFTHIPEWNLCTEDVEWVWSKLELPMTRPTYICMIYRPPSGNYDNFEMFLESKILDLYQNRTPDIVICGDINIDCNCRKAGVTKRYKAFLKGMGLIQGIKDATRSTVHSNTTIDHIITNREELYCTFGVVPLGISDHDMVFVTRKKAKIPHNFHYIGCCSYNNFDPIAFQRDIDVYNWDDIVTNNDVNAAVELINREFIKIGNKHAPFKHLKMRDNAPGWLNGDMLAHINEREYWSKKFKKFRTDWHLDKKVSAKRRTRASSWIISMKGFGTVDQMPNVNGI